MKYPIGIQNFEKIRTENYMFIDKTDLIFKMVNEGSYYILSRPRRFGKSLLLSTIHAYLSGRKDLFQGLAIENLEKDWKEYLIFHLDLNVGEYNTEESLNQKLDSFLTNLEEIYGKTETLTEAGQRFEAVIGKAYQKTGKKIVILVDEYDKPLLAAINNPELQNHFRTILKAFYGVLKSMDGCIKFALLTSVTKFGKISVFSDLNNLIDISMDSRYQTICGITEEEIHQNFEEPVTELASNYNISYNEALDKLKKKYDGYHFVENGKGIYNPFSLLNTLSRGKFGDYWFETGTPTYLVELLQQSNYPLENLTKDSITADTLNSIDALDSNPIPVIYQSGYLTIKDYDEEFKEYTLTYPNQEVEEGFTSYLLKHYAGKSTEYSPNFVKEFVKDLRKGNINGFMQRMAAMLSDTSYEIVGKEELYFQNTFFLISRMLGFYTEVERTTSNGRIDMIIKTKDYIYIFEFKMDQSAETALQQIEAKNYAAPFANDSCQLFKIGVNFSRANRCINDWKIVSQ